jgi:hypothetical protein
LEAKAELRNMQVRCLQALDAGDLGAVMGLFTCCMLVDPPTDALCARQ